METSVPGGNKNILLQQQQRTTKLNFHQMNQYNSYIAKYTFQLRVSNQQDDKASNNHNIGLQANTSVHNNNTQQAKLIYSEIV
jgi:hypothetical protein